MTERPIIPECYIDTTLIETLAPNKSGYNHKKGCPAVGKAMQENFKDRFAVGIIDKDKKAIKYLEEFTLEIETESLLLLKHTTKAHYIIQVVPAAEQFILDAAKELNINLEEFGLSNDLEGLKKYTKSQTSKENPNLKKAFKALKDAKSCKLLSEWVKYLHEKSFQCTIEELKKIKSSIID